MLFSICSTFMIWNSSNRYRVIFEREVPFEIRHYNGDEPIRQGTLELIRVKLLIAGADDSPISIRM